MISPSNSDRSNSGLSRFTYWKLKRGESNPDTSANLRLRSILAVAQTLDIELADLLPKHTPNISSRQPLEVLHALFLNFNVYKR